jgi:undecaprenyl diphosphate synthase
VTLFSFSTENWCRPPDEVAALMALLERYLTTERAELLDNGIRLQAIGQLHRLPEGVQAMLGDLCGASGQNEAMVLSLALSYGGRADIIEAARSLARDARDGALDPGAIDEGAFASRLATAGLPDPDLLIRTSGELRISNFLLWQLAYAEIYVTDVLWPDFRRPELLEAFRAYAARERRYGRTSGQLTTGS